MPAFADDPPLLDSTFCAIPMRTDPLKDVRAVRDQIGAECGYDLGRLGSLIRREEVKAGKRLIHAAKPATRRQRRTPAAEPLV